MRIDPEATVPGVPCRVSADLREYQRKLDSADARKFDPWDDGLMTDLFGQRLAGPLSSLLIAWEQVENTEQSFGADRDKVFEFLRPHLAALKDACVATYEDL